jgi:hypothetical protein
MTVHGLETTPLGSSVVIDGMRCVVVSSKPSEYHRELGYWVTVREPEGTRNVFVSLDALQHIMAGRTVEIPDR